MVIERAFIILDVRCFDYAYKWYVCMLFFCSKKEGIGSSSIKKSSVNSPIEKVPSKDEFRIHKLSSVSRSNISSS